MVLLVVEVDAVRELSKTMKQMQSPDDQPHSQSDK